MASPTLTEPNLATSASPEIAPLDLLERSLRGWWLVLLGGILGGLLALLVGLLQPPVYTATASLPIHVDYARTGPLEHWREDAAIDLILAKLTDPAMLNATVAQVNAAGIPLDLPTLKANAVVERYEADITFTYTHANPETAASVLNTWLDIAQERLGQAYGHAVAADLLLRRQTALEGCLSDSWCGSNRADVQAELAQIQASLPVELAAAEGVSAGLTMQLDTSADVPSAPSRQQTNLRVLAGLVAGLLVGVLLVTSGWLDNRLPTNRWLQRKPHA